MVLAVEAAARAEPPQTMATVGTVKVEPGAVSVIPARARLGIDVRAIASDSLRQIDAEIRSAAAEIAARRGVDVDLQLTRDGEPVALDADLVSAALRAAARLGIGAQETWSGGGHDAQHLAALTATLLLFVPLEGGESHTPNEGASQDGILNAGLIALDALRLT
jgi:acetylornithine deacetylase/succinyl-diaminopimelate desuccinylase-like protein